MQTERRTRTSKSELRGRLCFGFALALACGGKETGTRTQLPVAPPPLIETAPATLAQACSGEVRSWDLLGAEGQSLATSTGVCRRAPAADAPAPFELVSQLSSEGRTHYELHLWLAEVDGRPQPVHAELREAMATRTYTWTEEGLAENYLGDVWLRPRQDGAAPTWVVPSHAVYARELMVQLGVGRGLDADTGAGALQQLSFAPDQQRFSRLELQPRRTEGARGQMDLGAGHFDLRARDGNELQSLAQLRLVDFVDGQGRAVYRLRNDAPTRIEEALPAEPRPSYRLAADLEVRPADLPAAGEAPLLGAEIVLTKDGGTAPRPGVLFISGTGAQDRYGITANGEIDVGSHAIHDGLARAGFAVLRYDERGVGRSGIGDDATPGFVATVDDARRALAALAARPEVDATRLVIIGHGEGALIASLIADQAVRVTKAEGKRKRSTKHKAAALVVLAAPGRNIRELVYDEIRRSLKDQPEAMRERAVAEAQAIHQAALDDKDLPASAEPLRQWMQEIFAIDPSATLAALAARGLPIYALQGGKDFQTDPTRDFGPVQAAISSPRAAKANRAETLDQLDHLFKVEPGVSHPGHYRDLARTVDPDLVQRISQWLAQVLAR